MHENQDYRKADWSCPFIENREAITGIHRNREPDYHNRDMNWDRLTGPVLVETGGRSRCIIPAWQNLEAVALSRRMSEKKGRLQSGEGSASGQGTVPGQDIITGQDVTPGEGTTPGQGVSTGYCVTALSDLEDMDFDLLSDPLIQRVVQTITLYKDDPFKPLILEAESPFSVLAALMNPVDLYLCFEEEGNLLNQILHRIARAEAAYIRACVEAGCRIISIADPVGTMDLVGPDYFRDFCGASELYLMNMCQPFLDQALIHICKKMTRSLMMAGLVEVLPYDSMESGSGDYDYVDKLLFIAQDPGIHFVGMTCIHDRRSDPGEIYLIRMNKDVFKPET